MDFPLAWLKESGNLCVPLELMDRVVYCANVVAFILFYDIVLDNELMNNHIKNASNLIIAYLLGEFLS